VNFRIDGIATLVRGDKPRQSRMGTEAPITDNIADREIENRQRIQRQTSKITNVQ
jgi:hypothetical protein